MGGLKAGLGLAGGLLGGNQGGADLHAADPGKTGLAKVLRCQCLAFLDGGQQLLVCTTSVGQLARHI